jgi:predicted GH43/DUF377 family glycosyl hydrolase
LGCHELSHIVIVLFLSADVIVVRAVGYIVLDQHDPSRIIQRSERLVLTPTYDYETLCDGGDDCRYAGERKNVIFLCSATPTGNKDEFRLFYGAGDGNVGTAVVLVTVDSHTLD